VIVIKNRKTGEGVRYTVPDDQLVRILGWLKLEASARYDIVMGAGGLFTGRQVKERQRGRDPIHVSIHPVHRAVLAGR
jgi:hypothetical protein